MKTSDHINELVTALSKAQGEMTNPEKNKTAKIPTKSGSSFSYDYADLPSMIDHAKTILQKNGLSHFATLDYEDGVQCIVMRLAHNSGQWVESTWVIHNQNHDPKVIAAEITYARRYLFQSLIGVAAEEDLDHISEASPKGSDKFKSPPKLKNMVTPQEVRDAVYRVPFSPFKGLTLMEIPPKELTQYVNHVYEQARLQQKDIQGPLKEFLERSVEFLKLSAPSPSDFNEQDAPIGIG